MTGTLSSGNQPTQGSEGTAATQAATLTDVSAPDSWRWIPAPGYKSLEYASRAPGSRVRSPVESTTDAPEMFERRVALKMLTSSLAMHLEAQWRTGLFCELDDLLEEDGWVSGDRLPEIASFKTFLRLVIHLGHVRRPGLGSTHEGNIVAAWTTGRDRLTVECLAEDQLRWVLSKNINGEHVSVAGRCSVSFIPEALSPYSPEGWFDGTKRPA